MSQKLICIMIATVHALLTATGAIGASPDSARRQVSEKLPSSEVLALFSKMKNDDVSFRTSFVGWMPVFGGATKTIVENFDRKLLPALLKALEDSEKYVAAHMVLTCHIDMGGAVTAKEYNGLWLKFKEDDSGRIVVDEQNRKDLLRFWTDATTQK